MTDRIARRRALYVGFLVVTIAAGLASRRFPEWQPALLARYAGDTLWAAAVFWLFALFAPRARTAFLAVASSAFACLVEFGQRYHAPWLDAWRASGLGALVLGQGFLWSDLVCYAVGVCLAASVDAVVLARRDTHSRS